MVGAWRSVYTVHTVYMVHMGMHMGMDMGMHMGMGMASGMLRLGGRCSGCRGRGGR